MQVRRHLSFTVALLHNLSPAKSLIFLQLFSPVFANATVSVESEHSEGSPHSPQLFAQCDLTFSHLHLFISSLTYEHGRIFDPSLIGLPSLQVLVRVGKNEDDVVLKEGVGEGLEECAKEGGREGVKECVDKGVDEGADEGVKENLM